MDASRRLVRHGLTLFLLGLITGFAVPLMVNPRAGLAAHLEGVMNGTFLIAVGVAWRELALHGRVARVAYALTLYGTYANWVATTLGGVFGTHSGTPIAGAGHTGAPWQEQLVMVLLGTVGVSILVAVLLLLWAAWRRQPA